MKIEPINIGNGWEWDDRDIEFKIEILASKLNEVIEVLNEKV